MEVAEGLIWLVDPEIEPDKVRIVEVRSGVSAKQTLRGDVTARLSP